MTALRTKPDGGFCFVPVRPLMAAWWAYKRGIIKLVDLRVWLASFELLARRCAMEDGRLPRYTLAELKALVGGVGGEHTRHSVARLTRAGLVRWTESAIEHTGDVPEVGQGRTFPEVLSLVINNRRKVPMPRRVIRLLTKTSKASLIATTLGHALRCLYFRSGGVRPDGLCKASWVADVFEIDQRSVKRARSELAAWGLLSLGTARQFVLNRFGQPVTFALDWAERQSGLSPRKRVPTTKLSPPKETGISLPRSENQKPGGPGRVGVRIRTAGNLNRIVRSDLSDPVRLTALFEHAHRSGWVSHTESGRLRVFAGAQRALRCATRNAPGFFVTILKRGLWTHLAGTDEERARSLLGAMPRCDVTPHARPPLSARHRSFAGEDPVAVRAMIARSLLVAVE